jgi:Fur family zinc uptake transcriptional regulator
MKTLAFKQHNHQRCIDQALERAHQICHQRKVRLTPLRVSILALIWRSHKPLGAYALMDMLRQRRREEEGASTPIAPPTVYRVLDFLQQQGLVHRLATINAFIGCDHPASQHSRCFFICSRCQNTEEISVEAIGNAIDSLAGDDGFQVQSTAVEVGGLCPACQDRAP